MANSKTRTFLTYLYCGKCGQVFILHRQTSKRKKQGHAKHLYCIRCKETTKHYERMRRIKGYKNEKQQ